MADTDDLIELQRQIERGNLFAHTALSEQAVRANETDAMINGLVDYLVERGLVETEGLLSAVQAARTEAASAASRHRRASRSGSTRRPPSRLAIRSTAPSACTSATRCAAGCASR